MILGIDVGGVIVDRKRNDNTDTSLLGQNYLNAFAVEGALEAIRELNTSNFEGQIYIVSKCGPNVERKTREWMIHNKFPEKTGVPMEKFHFCRKRHEKAPICERLGITHFVDDRLEVLSYMQSVPNRFLFDPRPEEVQAFAPHITKVTLVTKWSELVGLLKR